MEQGARPLEEQKKEFKQNKLLATPIAGLIAWLIVFISSIQICIYPPGHCRYICYHYYHFK